jgi:hypothetical protein
LERDQESADFMEFLRVLPAGKTSPDFYQGNLAQIFTKKKKLTKR